VLLFSDRLVQHIPEKGARPFRSYGLFSTRAKTKLLAQARRVLGQKKRRRPRAQTWEQRRQNAGEKKPLSCPSCGGPRSFYAAFFGPHPLLAGLADTNIEQPLPTPLYLFPASNLLPAVNP
jgi:hypothetical protein